MKIKRIALLLLLLAAPAVRSEEPLKLALQMQAAILQAKDVQRVKALLQQGADINAPIGCGTFSLLDGAISTQNVEMLRFLLAHGAKPHGHELAHAAFASGHEEALRMASALLQAGMDPNVRDEFSDALIHATSRENIDLLKLLLSQPGIRLDESDDDGCTALMMAAKRGSLEMVGLLLHAGARVDVSNQRGETAASFAQQEIDKRIQIISRLHPTSD